MDKIQMVSKGERFIPDRPAVKSPHSFTYIHTYICGDRHTQMPIYIIYLCSALRVNVCRCKDMQRQLHDALAHAVMELNHNDISWVKAELLLFKMLYGLEIPLSVTCILLYEGSCICSTVAPEVSKQICVFSQGPG